MKRAKTFLFIRHFPKIERGAEIIVPKNIKNANSAQQVFQLVSVLTGTVTSVIGIITLIKATAN